MGELPWFLVSEASESLVLNMTFDGFILKIFLRCLSCGLQAVWSWQVSGWDSSARHPTNMAIDLVTTEFIPMWQRNQQLGRKD